MPAPRTPAPSADEIAKAIAAASAAQEEKGIAKHAPGVIVAIIIALLLWVGSTLLSMQTSVTTMTARFEGLEKSVNDLQQSQSASSRQLADLQAAQAASKARADASDADMSRVKERVRILEGQRPVTGQDANVAR